MISNQILQYTIDGLSSMIKYEISIIEREGKIVASTENKIGNYDENAEDFVNSKAENQLIKGYQYFKIYDNNIVENVVAIKGEDGEAFKYGKIVTFQVQNLLIAYKERYDKDNFIKNLLLDNLLLVDIYNRSKKLHIENNVKRVVFLIEILVDKDYNIVEIVRNIFPNRQKDFVTAVDEKSIILVKELKDNETKEDVDKISKMILDTLNSEAMKKVYVSTGTIVNDLKDVSKTYKEAKMALEVGKIFDEEKYVVSYEKLGIGRLIYQLPIPLCKLFIKEILQGKLIEEFDDESITTVNKFFDNNLNVSETSRQLFIHRNTLVYRLDKLFKNTGLDLRNFDDAIIFKITLMVNKYMKYMENMNY